MLNKKRPDSVYSLRKDPAGFGAPVVFVQLHDHTIMHLGPSPAKEQDIRPPVAWTAIICVVFLKILLHLVAIDSYGYFRDELYYLASTYRLDFGYVEHPPFSIWLLAAQTAVFGNSLVAVRGLAIVAGVIMIVYTALMAREIGGRSFAQGLAALAAVAAPELQGSGNIFSMNVIEQAIWPVAGFLFLRALQTGDGRRWILLGVVLGIGLLTKISVFWLGAGIAAALLFTPHRRWLGTRWPWVAGAVALVIFIPFVLWQARYGFPMLEFVRNATERKMVSVSPEGFVLNQILGMNPFTLPVVLAGLAGPWISRELRGSRVPLLIFFTVAAILLASGTSKTYYLAAAYPFLFVAGARSLELFTLGTEWREGIRVGAPAFMLAGCFLVSPLAIPLLPVHAFVRYAEALGISPEAEERHTMGPLPQHFADQFGWQELAEEVARVYHTLPPDDRARAAILGRNYGQAGAIDVLGRRLGLPRAISGHNTYWIWGPGEYDGEVLIIIGGTYEDHVDDFESLEESGMSDHPYAMPYERNLRIFVGRKLKVPVREAWEAVRFYI